VRRYVRQTRLAEIGDAGQARLAAHTVALGGDGFARWLEDRYLTQAGVMLRAPRGQGEAAPVDVGALGLTHPAAREVAEGAIRALAELRAGLGIGRSTS